MASTAGTLVVRPRRSLMGTAFISIVLGMVPVFGVLYWFGVQHGTWVSVLVVQLAITVAAVLTLVRQLSVYSAVTPTVLKGRGIFSPMETVPLGEIASVIIVPTLSGQATEPIEQLLVRDASGRRLFRMRGNFWHIGDLSAIAGALPVPTTTVAEPMSMSEFFRQYPGSAYWFENRPVVRVALLTGAVVLVAAAVLGIMAMIGIQVGFTF